MSFRLYAVVVALAVVFAGCATQQPYVVAPQVGDPTNVANAGSALQTSTANPEAAANNPSIADTHRTAAAVHPLPYKGRLVEGDPTELPPAVAAALSKDAPLTFTYREELTHDEYHLPMLFTAIDPVTYFGSPLGDYGVTADATLTIREGDRVLADYTAKAHVSKSYNLYSEPKHSELERAAREAVRARIEQKLYADAARVTRSTSAPPPSVPE